MNRRTRRTRQAAAGLLLAAIALAVWPRPAAARSAHECPPPASGVAAVAPAAEHCDHAPSGPCGSMLGCLSTPPAMLASPAGVRLLAPHRLIVVAVPAAFRGQPGLGPPTPPPNS